MQLRRGALIALWATAAAAQTPGIDPVTGVATRVATKVQLYTDTDRTVVVSPHVSATTTLPNQTAISATYTEDVVSSASVDVRSTASPRIYDRRQEVDLGVGQQLLGTQLGASATYSQERDYTSLGASFTASRELNRKNTTVELRLGHQSNVVGRADDPLFQAPRTDWSADLAVTQLLSPTTVAQLNATAARADGMIASPYRKVVIGDDQRYVMPENEPAERSLLAAALAVKQYLGLGLVGHLDYRFYADSYLLRSHTLDARLILDLAPVTLRLRYRFYRQNGAFFYQSTYDRPRVYVSADRELSPFSSHLFGAKAEWAPASFRGDHPALRLDAKVEAMYFSYSDFPALPSRWALISQAGLALDF